MVFQPPQLAQLLSFLLVFGLWDIQSTLQQDLSYLKFVQDATEFSPKAAYDYIVVGGGTAGCPLAATLSKNYTVLLIERGADAHSNANVMRQENILNNVLQFNDKNSPAESFTSEDGIPNVRGRVLGGSSMINYGYYSRSDADFYNVSGIKWDMNVVKSAYEWVEDTVMFRKDEVNSWQLSVKEALLHSGITPDNGFSLEHEVGTKTTATTFDKTGRRHGAVELLNKANPSNLQVIVNATVERVLFSSSTFGAKSAVGVIYTDSQGKSHEVQIHKEGEVILSAGTLGSPQLLLVSGVGPRTYLSSLKIPIVNHQPFVGQFMTDNPMNTITFASPFPPQPSGDFTAGIQKDDPYIFLAVSYVASFISPASRVFFPYPSAPLNVSLLTIVLKNTRPLSSGSLKLASGRNMKSSPSVRFNYFAIPRDLSLCANVIQTIGKVLSNPIMDQYKFQDKDGKRHFQIMGLSLPRNLSDRGQTEEFCRTTLTTHYHYHGGCTLQKVIDSDFKVKGINALRVVDSSTFVVTPGTNPQATVMMLGRYVGLKIQEKKTGHGKCTCESRFSVVKNCISSKEF